MNRRISRTIFALLLANQCSTYAQTAVAPMADLEACIQMQESFQRGMAVVLGADLPTLFRYTPPSYECMSVLNQAGRGGKQVTPPTKADYQAWVAMHDGFVEKVTPLLLKANRQAKQARESGLLVDAESQTKQPPQAGIDIFAKNVTDKNQKLLRDAYKAISDDNPWTKAPAVATKAPNDRNAQQCTPDVLTSIQKIPNLEMRKAAQDSYDKSCKAVQLSQTREKEQQATSARHEQDRQAKMLEMKIPTNADLIAAPSMKWGTSEQLKGLLQASNLTKVLVGRKGAKPLMMVFDPDSQFSKLELLMLWPSVREGYFSLNLVPVSRFGDTPYAAIRLIMTKQPYAVLDKWLTSPDAKLEHLKGEALAINEESAISAIEQNNLATQAAGVVGVPVLFAEDTDVVIGAWMWTKQPIPLFKKMSVTWTNKWTQQQRALLQSNGKLHASVEGDKTSANLPAFDTEICAENGECWMSPAPNKSRW